MPIRHLIAIFHGTPHRIFHRLPLDFGLNRQAGDPAAQAIPGLLMQSGMPIMPPNFVGHHSPAETRRVPTRMRCRMALDVAGTEELLTDPTLMRRSCLAPKPSAEWSTVTNPATERHQRPLGTKPCLIAWSSRRCFSALSKLVPAALTPWGELTRYFPLTFVILYGV